jgi:hypothetical protein
VIHSHFLRLPRKRNDRDAVFVLDEDWKH